MTRKKIAITLAVLCLLIAVAIGFAWGSGKKPKVVVIGLDGLTWKFLDPLMARGELPNLKRFFEGAATGDLRSHRPTQSVILWTSIATGKSMAKHGIVDWTLVDRQTRKNIEKVRLTTGRERTAATIWEILGEKGYSVGVINWWVTYPAVKVNGFLISDRLRDAMEKESIAREKGVVYPPSLADELVPPGRKQRLDQAIGTMRRFGFPIYNPSEGDESKPIKVGGSEWLFRQMPIYVGQDEMVADWALHMLGKGQPDFFGVILRLTDVFAHVAWIFVDQAVQDRSLPWIRIEDLTSQDEAVRQRAEAVLVELDRHFADAVLPGYRFADDFVGKILSQIDDNSIVVIVSDHGFCWIGDGYNHVPDASGTYPSEAPPGVIAIKGKGIRPVKIKGMDQYDVCPTILEALNEPVAEDMDGKPVQGIFAHLPLLGKKVKRIASYGTGARWEGAVSGAGEQEALEDLRALGYVR